MILVICKNCGSQNEFQEIQQKKEFVCTKCNYLITIEENSKTTKKLHSEIENKFFFKNIKSKIDTLYITIALLFFAFGITTYILLSFKKDQKNLNQIAIETLSNKQIGNLKDSFDFIVPQAKIISDYAGLLKNEEITWLEAKLIKIDFETSNQIALLVIDSLKGIPIEYYATKVFNFWGIGQKNILKV